MAEPSHDLFPIKRRGLMLVLSSPSGAGKSTIARSILDSDPEIDMSVSVTTRPKRPGEVEGRDYIFIDRTEFDLMVNRGQLLEHAKVFDNYYGTPRAAVMDALAEGRLHPATKLSGAGASPEHPRPGFPGRHRRAHGQGIR